MDQKPNEFVNSFNAQMQQKVTDIITGYKAELAKGYLAPEEPEEEPEEEYEEGGEDSYLDASWEDRFEMDMGDY